MTTTAIDQALRAQPGEPDRAAAQTLYWSIQDADPHVCALEQLEELLAQARDPYTRGYLAGIMQSRTMIEHLAPWAGGGKS